LDVSLSHRNQRRWLGSRKWDDQRHIAPVSWTQPFGLNDINTLIPANSGWTIVAASGVNVHGQICGLGQMADGTLHAVLLNPN